MARDLEGMEEVAARFWMGGRGGGKIGRGGAVARERKARVREGGGGKVRVSCSDTLLEEKKNKRA